MANGADQRASRSGRRPLLSALGLLVLLGFTGTMLFVGFATLRLDCSRERQAPPDCRLHETRLFGLSERRLTVAGVTGVGYATQDVDVSSRETLASTVRLQTAQGSVALTEVTSNVGDEWKARVVAELGAFLAATERTTFSLEVVDRNLFGWVGVGFAALLGLSTLVWAVGLVTGSGSKRRGTRR